MNASRYLARLGLARTDLEPADRHSLARLQRAHVTSVPFENLSIAGTPLGTYGGEGVSLDLAALYEKIVERERGGFCYELNGLFGWLLDELGFECERVAGRVLGSDGQARPPANHLINLVELDRRYVVDVGIAIPTMRQPLPLSGEVRRDDVGVAWRVTESDRPDADYCTQFRRSRDGEWQTRYVFRDRSRDLSYVAATCEYLASAPESPFTGDPFVTIATDDGHRRLDPGTLTIMDGNRRREERVLDENWHVVLESAFGIPTPP